MQLPIFHFNNQQLHKHDNTVPGEQIVWFSGIFMEISQSCLSLAHWFCCKFLEFKQLQRESQLQEMFMWRTSRECLLCKAEWKQCKVYTVQFSVRSSNMSSNMCCLQLIPSEKECVEIEQPEANIWHVFVWSIISHKVAKVKTALYGAKCTRGVPLVIENCR